MWNPNRNAKVSCQLTYAPVKDMPKFPLPIINKVSRVDKALREWGLPGIEICGDRITASDPGQDCSFKPYSNGPWINRIVTQNYSDKFMIISCMCVLIALWQEDFVKQCELRSNGSQKEDAENMILWQTAWSIILDMEAKNENN